MRNRKLPGAFVVIGIVAGCCLGIGAYAEVLTTPSTSMLPQLSHVSAAPQLRAELQVNPLQERRASIRNLAQSQASAAQGQQTSAASVQTDKFDYQPGETALISGAGFLSGETVTLQVHHVSGVDDGTGHGPFYALADQAGQISNQWYVDPDDSLHAIFILTAEGGTSGRRASTIFTDTAITVVDDQGPDDYSGQKDLSFLTVDYAGASSGSIAVTWGWDDTAWSGNNTGDACTLFDTNSDGKANYSLCITVGGIPAAYLSTRLYSCSDARSDRCTQPTLLTNMASVGAASRPSNSDPFGVVASPYYAASHTTGNKCGARPACYTTDTVAALAVQLSDFGGLSAKLLNVCSYPSQEPNSDPSECVITPNNGFLNITKVATPSDSTTFTFNLGTGQTSQNGTSSWPITGSGSQLLISFAPGTYDLKEAIPAGWKLDSASCQIQDVAKTATGTPVTSPVNGVANAGVTGFAIQTGLETTCTFTDSKQLGSIKIVKNSLGGDGTFNFTPVGFNSGTGFSLSTFGGTKDQTFGSLSPGTGYSITESATTGFYQYSTPTCDNGTPAAIQVLAGGTTTCTFTNAKASMLKLVKTVINDNGGTAVVSNFTLQAGATTFTSGVAQVISPGLHNLSESGPSGYSASAWSCAGFTNGGTSTASSVTLGIGENVQCDITNNDNAAHLIIIKNVVNDNGLAKVASNFSGTISGVTVVGGNTWIGEASPGVEKTLSTVGAYGVTETADLAYTTTYSADCSSTIALGQTKTCTVTNNDNPASPQGTTTQKVILHDSISIPGIRPGASNQAAASATFRLYTNDTCTPAAAVLVSGNPYAETITLGYTTVSGITTGSAATLTGVTVPQPLATTTYYWTVQYTGDSNNSGVTTACGIEKTTLKIEG